METLYNNETYTLLVSETVAAVCIYVMQAGSPSLSRSPLIILRSLCFKIILHCLTSYWWIDLIKAMILPYVGLSKHFTYCLRIQLLECIIAVLHLKFPNLRIWCVCVCLFMALLQCYSRNACLKPKCFENSACIWFLIQLDSVFLYIINRIVGKIY